MIILRQKFQPCGEIEEFKTYRHKQPQYYRVTNHLRLFGCLIIDKDVANPDGEIAIVWDMVGRWRWYDLNDNHFQKEIWVIYNNRLYIGTLTCIK